MDTFIENIENQKNWKEKLQIGKTSTHISIPHGYSKKAIEKRWNIIMKDEKMKEYYKKNPPNTYDPYYKGVKEELLTKKTLARSDFFTNNIENFIGMVEIPLGIAGPLTVKGMHANGNYLIPLCTSEAALVASYSRGISALNRSGGVRCVVIEEGISRDPNFLFTTIIEVGDFLIWCRKNEKKFKEISERTTKYGKLKKIKYHIDSNNVHIKFKYYVGDAGGQNMTTIATAAVVEWIQKNSPVPIKYVFLEGGLSGDKKATNHSLISCRGKKVCAEAIIKKDVLKKVLHATPEQVVWGTEVATRGYHWLGSIAFNAHFANGITAMGLALGQDPACVSESHIGCSRVELTKDGDLYISCTAPNIICATVGGGTKLPTARACLEMMGLYGPGNANALAEIIGAVLVAGELSLGAALLNGNFSKAHQILARDTKVLEIDYDNDTLDEQFMKSQAFLVKLSRFPDQKKILQIYSLYKQATIGDCNITAPWFYNVKARAKYDAWLSRKGMKSVDAKVEYIRVVMELWKHDQEVCKSESNSYAKKEDLKFNFDDDEEEVEKNQEIVDDDDIESEEDSD